ncbi:MAG: PadR family transcriptional regulator [Betaproteobacteria bacterium]
MPPAHLGEFEQQLLLIVLRLGREAYGADIARELEALAGRTVTRGALYATLDRLETKGFVRWKLAPGGAAREGLPRRLYAVTAAGLAALRSSHEVLQRLWRGVEHLLREPHA